MPSSGISRRVGLVRKDVSEEPSASSIRVTRKGELGTLAVTSNRRTLRRRHSSNHNLIKTRTLPSSEIQHLIILCEPTFRKMMGRITNPHYVP
jgi:hypothetical protein